MQLQIFLSKLFIDIRPKTGTLYLQLSVREMVQWPGRRGKMVKWRTPFGKWASYAIFGTYAFIGWNLIPVAVYYVRKQTYQVS